MSNRISVIIPCCNRAVFIGRAIRSVLDQTLACAELLVVDDGSTDNSREIVRQMAGQSRIAIRLLVQENRGVSAARNRGIHAAQHDILAFLDSDDNWHKSKLEQQLTAMSREPDYLISHTRELWFRNGKQVNQKKKHAPPHGDIFLRSLGMCVVGMSTVMVRRQLFDRYGLFDEDLLCCEDYDLWLRVSKQEHFLLVDEPLTMKDGGRPDQLSTIHRMGMDTWRIRALCKLLNNGGLTGEQQEALLAELRRKCTIYGNGCIKHGRRDEGERYLGLPDEIGLKRDNMGC
jgi:glycosyltransferase involved in cell wall biosynthesis